MDYALNGSENKHMYIYIHSMLKIDRWSVIESATPWRHNLLSVSAKTSMLARAQYWRQTTMTADRLAQLVEQRTAVREVAGSNLDKTNTQGL